MVLVLPITIGLTSSPIVYPSQSLFRFFDILSWVNVSLVTAFVANRSSIHSRLTTRYSVGICDVSLDLLLGHYSPGTRIMTRSLHRRRGRWVLSCRWIGCWYCRCCGS